MKSMLIALMAAGSLLAGGAALAQSGADLAGSKGCGTCHAADAKKVAGSPGSTRISVKVTITTPRRAGIDARSRRPTRRAIPASKSLHPAQVAEVGLAVELIGIAVDRFCHRGVFGLPQG